MVRYACKEVIFSKKNFLACKSSLFVATDALPTMAFKWKHLFTEQ